MTYEAHVLGSCFFIWYAHADLTVKLASSTECSIRRIRSICCTDHNDGLVVVLLPRHVWPKINTGVCSTERETCAPSIHVRSCATIHRSISLCTLSRLGVMASISSTKSRHGTTLLASSNVSRSVFFDSPDMPGTTDGAEMLMNGTPSSRSVPMRTQHETLSWG